MKAVGQFAGGISAYDAGKYTRRVMNVNAQNAQTAGLEQRDRIRSAARQAMGGQLVGQGSDGFQMGTGSALDALRQSAINRELDLAVSRQRAGTQAADFTQKGKIAYAQGKAALAGGILSGVETIAETIASAYTGGAGATGGAAIPPPDLSKEMSFSGGFDPSAAQPASSLPGGL